MENFKINVVKTEKIEAEVSQHDLLTLLETGILPAKDLINCAKKSFLKECKIQAPNAYINGDKWEYHSSYGCGGGPIRDATDYEKQVWGGLDDVEMLIIRSRLAGVS